MLCVGWGCEGVKVLPLLCGFSCKVYLSVSPRFYFRRHAFCFLPLIAILESSAIKFWISFFVKDVSYWLKFYFFLFLHVKLPFLSHQLLIISLSLWITFKSLSNISFSNVYRFISGFSILLHWSVLEVFFLFLLLCWDTLWHLQKFL
jgi:hypothetical protein